MATTKPRTLPLSKRGLNFEMFMWLFTRLSALGMYALILFAIMGALFMGARNDMNFADVLRWGFMPNSTHVQSTNVPDLAPWSTPFWRLTASALLLLAVAVTMVIIPAQRLPQLPRLLLLAVAVTMMILPRVQRMVKQALVSAEGVG